MSMLQILTEPPPSGELPARHYGAHFASALWVRFDPPSDWGSPWVASFARLDAGHRTRDQVAEAGSVAVIAAGGLPYVVEIASGRLLRGPVDGLRTLQLWAAPAPRPVVIAVVSEDFFQGRLELVDETGEVAVLAGGLRATSAVLVRQVGHVVHGWLLEAVPSEADLRFVVDLDARRFELLDEIEHHERATILRKWSTMHSYRLRPRAESGSWSGAPAPGNGASAAIREGAEPFGR